MLFGTRKNSAAASTIPPSEAPAPAAQPVAAAAPDAAIPASAHEGSGARQPADPSSLDERRRRAALSLRRSTAFTQIVSLLMRSPAHKHLSLSDLEWLVLPPLMTGQFRIAKIGSRKAGIAVPAAVVLWASVSAEVDAKLSASPRSAVRLRPDEWRSGDIIWLVEAVGDPRVISQLLKGLHEKTFKDRAVKVRKRDGQGAAIDTLGNMIAKSLPN